MFYFSRLWGFVVRLIIFVYVIGRRKSQFWPSYCPLGIQRFSLYFIFILNGVNTYETPLNTWYSPCSLADDNINWLWVSIYSWLIYGHGTQKIGAYLKNSVYKFVCKPSIIHSFINEVLVFLTFCWHTFSYVIVIHIHEHILLIK